MPRLSSTQYYDIVEILTVMLGVFLIMSIAVVFGI